MDDKVFIRLHLLVVAIAIVEVLLRVSGWSFRTYILMAFCIGYFFSLIAVIPIAIRRLRQIKQATVRLVFVLAGVFMTEVLVGLMALVYGFMVLFAVNEKTVVTGQGYVVRLVSSIAWPGRYVLFRGNALAEKYLGGVSANEEDFNLDGKIIVIEREGDAIRATIKRSNGDTTILFQKGK